MIFEVFIQVFFIKSLSKFQKEQLCYHQIIYQKSNSHVLHLQGGNSFLKQLNKQSLKDVRISDLLWIIQYIVKCIIPTVDQVWSVKELLTGVTLLLGITVLHFRS